MGFVGLGHMGSPMSAHLFEAGYAVRGYDVVPEARTAFADRAGGTAVAELTRVADGAAAVILMLPDSAVVRQVVLEGGLLDALAPGCLLIDMSSSEPTETQELAVTAAASGITLIDAPVSGGVRGAEAATLTIMVGGPGQEVERCRPLLETMGSKVLHVGGSGAGHALKALNNLLSATTLLASAEALLVGTRFGLDPEVMLDAINSSTGRSYSTELKLPEYVLPRTFSSGFDLRLMVKDLRTAVRLADATGSPLRLGAASSELWGQAERELPADADHTEIARWLESAGGTPPEGR